MNVLNRTPIHLVQGTGLISPMSGQSVRVRGVVTGKTRHGFFVQDPERPADAHAEGLGSSAIYVSAQFEQVSGMKLVGALVDVEGVVLDFTRDENDHPCTQIQLEWVSIVESANAAPDLAVLWLNAENLPSKTVELAAFLNAHEFMLTGIRAGAVFSAPSNPFGDYVVLPLELPAPRSKYGTAIVDPKNPEAWYPGFRITRTDQAPKVNVGDVLMSDVSGPLNYRVGAYQIAASGPLQVERRALEVNSKATKVASYFTSVLTLNAFNLDPHIEDPALVEDADKDVDDDIGDGRFDALARVIVEDAHSPELVALQEIQDNDGAEITEVANASRTFEVLIEAVQALGGPWYEWADLPPISGADGGQPGGNIRNGYLYDPARVRLVADSMVRLGDQTEAYDGSRKALKAEFEVIATGKRLALINVHLASKRHQYSIFAPNQPGFDPRESQRIVQAEIIRDELLRLIERGVDYYVTGDFNDFEFSDSVLAMLGDESVNLVNQIPADERFDYNHRGKLHTLMQGVISKRQFARGNNQFEIMHGSDLLGVQPGSQGERATDHGYVVAHLVVE
jgi:uncharacterized protein